MSRIDAPFGIEHLHRCFGKIGKVAGSGQRLLAVGEGGLARGADLGDLVLDQTLLQRGRRICETRDSMIT